MRYQTNVFLDRSDISNLRTGKPIIIEQANGAPPIIIQAEGGRQSQVDSGGETLKCDLCGDDFKNAHGLNVHKVRKHPNKLKCKLCDREFGSQLAISMHRLKTHGLRAKAKTKNTEYKCQTCGKSFTNHYGYAAHQRAHKKGGQINGNK